MIIIKVHNGLGNQLFIYAFGLYLQTKYPEQDIRFDFSELPRFINGRRTYQFTEIFNTSFNDFTAKDVRLYYRKPFYFRRPYSNKRSIYNRIIRKITGISVKNHRIRIINEPSTYWDIPIEFINRIKSFEPMQDSIYVFNGFWEDTDYMLPISSVIKNSMRFNLDKININLANLLESDKEVVAVHVRRKDYIVESTQNKFPKNIYAICSKKYYDEALQILSNRVPNAYFLFFTDDPEFVEDTFKNVSNKSIVQGNKDYEDLYLMTLCKHSIIANSTFSFWGAFLKKEKGIVIAPKVHYVRALNEDTRITKMFFLINEWIYLDNSVS